MPEYDYHFGVPLTTTVFDAKNNKQETFANGSGLTVKNLQYKHINPDTVLTTLFEYDEVNQLKKVTELFIGFFYIK